MKAFDLVREKLENWKKSNDKCLVKAEKRKDFDAIKYFKALNFATDRAIGFMDDVEEMQSNKSNESNDDWIPVNPDDEDTFPKNDDYVLVSFSNWDVVSIGRYEVDEDGGAFYPGDEDKSYASMGVFVNAWRPLPKPYREVEDE